MGLISGLIESFVPSTEYRVRRTVQSVKSRAQVTMELALAMIGVVIIFLGCINTFIWLSRVLVVRQRFYEKSRVDAASVPMSPTPQERQVDENWLPRLNTLK